MFWNIGAEKEAGVNLELRERSSAKVSTRKSLVSLALDPGCVAVQGSVYIGKCPDWGEARHARPVASGVVLQAVRFHSLALEEDDFKALVGLPLSTHPIVWKTRVYQKPDEQRGGVVLLNQAFTGLEAPVNPDEVALQAHRDEMTHKILSLTLQVSSTPVGRGRFMAPFALGQFLRNIFDESLDLDIRIGCTKVVANLVVGDLPCFVELHLITSHAWE